MFSPFQLNEDTSEVKMIVCGKIVRLLRPNDERPAVPQFRQSVGRRARKAEIEKAEITVDMPILRRGAR